MADLAFGFSDDELCFGVMDVVCMGRLVNAGCSHIFSDEVGDFIVVENLFSALLVVRGRLEGVSGLQFLVRFLRVLQGIL